jgi:hypothetical protein
MDGIFSDALCLGYERLAAWAGLLDRINVFPVADADTGQNLKISLAPLRQPGDDNHALSRALLLAATGNSGNIAAAFLAGLLTAENVTELANAIHHGREQARQAVADPQPGTMLTVFDALVQITSNDDWNATIAGSNKIISHLEQTVADTRQMLPVLQEAGVIDAGALGMFIFLEAFFLRLVGPADELRAVTDIFPNLLTVAPEWKAEDRTRDYCVNALVLSAGAAEEARRRLVACGRSVVLSNTDDGLKIHLHTEDRDALRRSLESIGPVLAWSEESMVETVNKATISRNRVHIVTDAAGSFTLADAQALDVTLLNSYLIVGGHAYPETLYEPERLYEAMRRGVRVSTAQASIFERHQSYLSAVERHQKIIYLCVGSVYTGNYAVASAWCARLNRPERMTIIDTGAASGRLGLIALVTARLAGDGAEPETVQACAQEAVERCQEFVFLDQLKFLAAGGRISKARGFFGDLLHLKPVISPTPQGAVKVAVTRYRDDQIDFALKKLSVCFQPTDAPLIMIQYTDNRNWVEETAAARIRDVFPAAEIILRPLSLTSGAHMGPATWAVAFLPTRTSMGNGI